MAHRQITPRYSSNTSICRPTERQRKSHTSSDNPRRSWRRAREPGRKRPPVPTLRVLQLPERSHGALAATASPDPHPSPSHMWRLHNFHPDRGRESHCPDLRTAQPPAPLLSPARASTEHTDKSQSRGSRREGGRERAGERERARNGSFTWRADSMLFGPCSTGADPTRTLCYHSMET